ncbi:MAG: SagB/ThcOx family dehydrogenase [Myxococcales bacterium]|nr:SagB/ThcOx family dehydrogenase [Myxococcales bacterium]
MNRRLLASGIVIALALACRREPSAASAAEGGVALPAPRSSGAMSVEAAIAARRSSRSFSGAPLTDAELGQLLWAAQGVTEPTQGLRAAPSAGALYPLVVYVVSAEGVRRYEPQGHGLARVAAGDRRPALAKAALSQPAVAAAPVSLVVVGVVSRTRAKYGDRAERYAAMEAGHAAQNVLLQATALGLGAAPIGAFDDDAIRAVLQLDASATPFYVVPVGRR